MRILLDTHTLLWFFLNDSRLSARALALLVDPSNAKHVSPATYWEIAIKLNVGKYTFNVSYDEFIQRSIYDNGFVTVPVEPRHTSVLVTLPQHHKDPFDRLLIAQSMAENLPIVSNDTIFDKYPVKRLW